MIPPGNRGAIRPIEDQLFPRYRRAAVAEGLMMRHTFSAVAWTAFAALLFWAGLGSVSNAAGVLLTQVPRAKAPAGPQQSSLVAVQTFGAWEVRCEKVSPTAAKQGSKAGDSAAPTRVYAGVTISSTFPCRAVAESHLNNNPLLEIRVVFLIMPQKPMIRVLAVFPPRFTLSALKGPKLKLDATAVQLRPYPRCDPLSCGAAIELPVGRLSEIQNAKSVTLELPDLPGTKSVEYSIPASGLSSAMGALQKLANHNMK